MCASRRSGGSISNGIDSILNYLNIGNGSRKSVRQGKSFSEKEKSQTLIDYQLTQEDRAWQESMYQKYQSYSGQMEDMQKAGLNPAMMYDGTNLGSFGASSAPVQAADSEAGMSNPGLSDAMSVMQMLTSFAGGASDMISKQQGVTIDKQNADTQQANVTGENALRAEQENTERERQSLLREQRIALQNENNTFNEVFTWKRTNQMLSELQAEANINLTYADIKKANAEISSIETNEAISELRFYLDYDKIQSDIRVNEATIESLRASVKVAIEDAKGKSLDNGFKSLQAAYGVGDPSTAVIVDMIAQGIKSETQRVKFVASVRRAQLSESTSSKSMWQVIDRIIRGVDIEVGSGNPEEPNPRNESRERVKDLLLKD